MRAEADVLDVSDAAAEEIEHLRREVARLTQENRAYARSMDVFRAAVKTTIHELDTQLLAQAFAKLATQVASAERATVAVLEHGAIIMQEHARYGDSAIEETDVAYIYPVELKPGPGCGLAPRVVTSAQTAVCHTPRTDANLGADFAARHKVRNVACVPVINHQTTVLAFIEVTNRRGGALFTQDDLRGLEALALAASVGLQRARLLDRLGEWSRALEMLLGFSAAINQHLDPVHLIRQLVENAGLFLKADGGMAGLSMQNGDAPEMVCDGLWNRGVWHPWQRRWARQEGMAGFVMENEFPYLSNEYPTDPLADAELVHDFNVRQALCVPIKNQNDAVIGFFELHRSTPQTPFNWQDAAFLESLANVTAVSIRNAQLLKALEARGQEIRALSANHVTRLEEERQHISRELHDEAGQILIGIKLALQVAARQIPEGHTNLRRDLDDLRDQVNQATRRLKDLARWLRPPTLDQLGLEIALQQLASDLKSRANFDVKVSVGPLATRLPQSWEIALYRVAQEALTNVLRHADANCAELELRCKGDHLCLIVRDSGRGFDPAAASGGLGLLGMKERASMLNGTLTVNATPGRGTEIRMEVPHP